jgi:hypothetical protein
VKKIRRQEEQELQEEISRAGRSKERESLGGKSRVGRSEGRSGGYEQDRKLRRVTRCEGLTG